MARLLECDFLKAASMHCSEPLFLRELAQTGVPLCLSTGMTNLEQVEDAVNSINEEGEVSLSLLQCTTAYPAPVVN